MSNIKISVIVPVFNCSKYIGNTLDSIINQNFDSFEIIVVDDGSTDNSLDIITKKLENSNIPNIIIHQENQGVSIARNNGIKASNGDYLVFVDGDDYILSNHLSTLFNDKYDFSLIQSVKKDGDKLSNPHHYHENEIKTDEFIKKELNMQIPFNFCQLIYKADIIKNNNIKFSERVIYGEDTEFALKALIYGESIKINNEITYYYIQHSDSAIRKSELKRFNIVDVFENLANFYRKNDKNELADLIIISRIPKAIFGNMNYFFHNNYEFDSVISKMKELNLFSKLSKFKGDRKFNFKIKFFLFNPKLYYKLWMKFKNSID